MYIDGQWTHAKNNKIFKVFNPATSEKIAEVPDGSRDDAARAIDAAGRAFQTWSRLTAYQRSKYLISIPPQPQRLSAACKKVDWAGKAAEKESANIWKPSWGDFRYRGCQAPGFRCQGNGTEKVKAGIFFNTE